MSTKFFRNYPKIEYLIDRDGSTVLLTDISRAVSVNSLTVPDDMSNYTLYDIYDGDRPDIVSHKLYGDVQYYWTFFIINDRLKAGYNLEWPLSAVDFSRMIENEYAKYSAITFLPTKNLDLSSNTDFSLIPLNETYLPYLKLSLLDNTSWAKILKYDTTLHQCIVYDPTDINSGISVSRESFVKYKTTNPNNQLSGKTDYKVVWDDSVLIGESNNDSQQDMIDRNARLKRQWIDEAFENFTSVDKSGLDNLNAIEYNDQLSEEEIVVLKQSVRDNYVLNKRLLAASNFFRWNNYYDAARYYISGSKTVTAYDVLSNENVIFHEYLSNIAYETQINDSKRQIRTIKPEYIRQFSEEYFEILNS